MIVEVIYETGGTINGAEGERAKDALLEKRSWYSSATRCARSLLKL